MNFDVPDYVELIIAKLQETGYTAYVVGGAVRDMILGVPVHDYDVATSATPEQVKKVFKDYKVIETGIKHGTVTVMIDWNSCEITTFRSEGRYTDYRHPDTVSFETDIKKDLARRDFTFNAIALDLSERKKQTITFDRGIGTKEVYEDYMPRGLVDPFNGLLDLQRGVIKTVGDAKQRFTEDHLRIMRLLRFFMQLGNKNHQIHIDEKTYKAALECMPLLQEVSYERISDELTKTLVLFNYRLYSENSFYQELFCNMISTMIPEMQPCIGYYQGNPYHCYDVFAHSLYALSTFNDIPSNGITDTALVLALFFHDIGKPRTATLDKHGIVHFYGHSAVSENMARCIMQRLRYDNQTINEVCELIKYHDVELSDTTRSINRMVNKLRYTQYDRLIVMRHCDMYAQNHNYKDYQERQDILMSALSKYNRLQYQQGFVNLKTLNINGRDLLALGIKQGKKIGQILNLCLQKVLDGEITNDKQQLLAFAKKYVDEDVPFC